MLVKKVKGQIYEVVGFPRGWKAGLQALERGGVYHGLLVDPRPNLCIGDLGTLEELKST